MQKLFWLQVNIILCWNYCWVIKEESQEPLNHVNMLYLQVAVIEISVLESKSMAEVIKVTLRTNVWPQIDRSGLTFSSFCHYNIHQEAQKEHEWWSELDTDVFLCRWVYVIMHLTRVIYYQCNFAGIFSIYNCYYIHGANKVLGVGIYASHTCTSRWNQSNKAKHYIMSWTATVLWLTEWRSTQQKQGGNKSQQ